MRIKEVTAEAIDPTGANTGVESHIKVLSKGEGNNKITAEVNTKATVDNLIPPVAAIIIITMAIIKVGWLWLWWKLLQTLWSQKRQLLRP